MSTPRADTGTSEYARYLAAQPAWKRWLDVQAPYRWNLRRLALGFTLDLGCGTGRNLAHLGGHGVGVDPNARIMAVAIAVHASAHLDNVFRAPEGETRLRVLRFVVLAIAALFAARSLHRLPRASASSA